jgi:hypothetical protein
MSTEELILMSQIREEINRYNISSNEEARQLVQQLFSICVDGVVVEVCREWLNNKGYVLLKNHSVYDKKQ